MRNFKVSIKQCHDLSDGYKFPETARLTRRSFWWNSVQWSPADDPSRTTKVFWEHLCAIHRWRCVRQKCLAGRPPNLYYNTTNHTLSEEKTKTLFM